MIWRGCIFAQSLQSLRWLHLKKGFKWRLKQNCLYQLCDLGTYRISEQQMTRRACTFAKSPFADCTKKKECRWRLRPNCLYQFMWFSYLSHMTRRTCTCAKDRKIMFEFLSSCGWEDLFSTFEKSEEKNLPWRLWFLHMHKVKRKSDKRHTLLW